MQLVAVIFQLQSLQQFGGVGATHIDWTMVPYVRKSFMKHFKNGLKYVEGEKENEIKAIIDNLLGFDKVENIEITDERYKQFAKAWQYAYDMTNKEIHQGVEGLYHNLNTLQSRSGNQLPFTSLNYGTCTLEAGRMVTKALLEVSIEGLGNNGVTSIFPCGIFQYKKGINDKPGTPNYDLKRLALESTTKRIYPNYANSDWSNNTNALKQDRKQKQEYIDSLDDKTYEKLWYMINQNQDECMEKVGLYAEPTFERGAIKVDMNERPIEFFNTMGCRTVNLLDINALDNFKRNVQCIIDGKYDDIDDVFSAIQKDGRGNVCPVTIILPTLAAMTVKKIESKAKKEDRKYNSEEVWEEFIKLLDKKLHEAKDMLLERFNHICSQSPKSARFMYENHTMCGYHEDEGIISALKHGTIVIGQLGMSEALYIMFGYDHTTEKGMEKAKQIEQLWLDRTSEFKKEYKLNFGVYYTPAENLCHTAFKKFRKAFPEFDLENVTYFINENGEKEYKEYFTNSMHVPVYYECDPFKKIDIESELTGYSNAGCITYTELPSNCYYNIDAVEKLVDYMMEKDIPYGAINISINQCHNCHERIWDTTLSECPKCGSTEIDELGRCTGYLSTTVKHFNKGKQCEFYDRVKHIKN